MKISLNWAQEYSKVDLKSLTKEELVKLATERLGGVEGYDDLGKHYDGIVVAKVISCQKHPNADKLNLCKIDDDGVVKDVQRDENDNIQVVCGAPNVKEGLLVAWIPPSAIVPSSYGEKELFVLEARDLRGQLSNGMLASSAELGLSDDHSGILEIEEYVKPGTPFKDLYQLDDVIIDIENKMFTHRPDCFGQLGLARELAGIQHLKFESPDWYINPSQVKSGSSEAIKGLSVTVEVDELCPRYMAVCLDNVEIKQSPVWLQSSLKRVGIKPINNVVDITNYMMMLTAQPLHAFDFDKVAKDGKAEIIVRHPKTGEKMTLLDGKDIEPHKDAVLICANEKPIALGGVMGGGNSEIDANTKRVVLECATFDMYNIRKTSMIHGIFTDAVTRFNKGQPTEQLPSVISKTVDMLQELAGANAVGEVVDNYHDSRTNQPVEVSVEFINKRLGSSLSKQEITKLLTNVEFSIQDNGETLTATAPFWRTDIEIPEDIVEEVGRLYGFNNLPIELPVRSIKPVLPQPALKLKQEIREILSRAGANEVLTYSFVHGNLLKKVGQKPEDSYAIRNALSPDLQYYRQTLTPSLLDLVHGNIKAGFDQFALFELNKTHNKQTKEDAEGLPGELNMIAFTFASKNQSEPAYFTARKYLDYLADQFGFTLKYDAIDKEPGYAVTQPYDFKRSAFVTIKEGDVFLGIIGEYKQSVCKNLKLPKASAGFELGLDHILGALDKQEANQYRPLSKYPSTEQDVTLKVAQELPYSKLEDLLKSELESTDYQVKLKPLSIYSKEGETTRNLSFRITISHQSHTLTTAEVNSLIEKLTWQAHEQRNAEQV